MVSGLTASNARKRTVALHVDCEQRVWHDAADVLDTYVNSVGFAVSLRRALRFDQSRSLAAHAYARRPTRMPPADWGTTEGSEADPPAEPRRLQEAPLGEPPLAARAGAIPAAVLTRPRAHLLHGGPAAAERGAVAHVRRPLSYGRLPARDDAEGL